MVYSAYRDLCRDHNEYLETFLMKMKKSFWDLSLREQLFNITKGIESANIREQEYHEKIDSISDLPEAELKEYIEWSRTL